jgi:DNA-binding NtrC family response regulator
MLNILVVDDDEGIRSGLAYPLSDAGHSVTEARDGVDALERIAEQVFDVVICDVRLPKVDGLAVLRHLKDDAPATKVILMTAYGRVSDAITALRAGAYDYVTKPFEADEFPLNVIEPIEAQRALSEALRRARHHLDGRATLPIVGRSRQMMRLLDRIDTIAESDTSVLITGESGTGKELIARTLHDRSARASGPFVAVNCAALPETLLEAELFGHERGAFTGAVRKRDGRFRAATGGTLLLDEVAEMTPAAQTKLLRVLQEGTIEPLGANAPVHVDVRVISATHQNLRDLVADGRFREDLYYRLHVLDLQVPPLRERTSDLPLLFEHFLAQFTPPGRAQCSIAPRAWAKIMAHPFPGNVREFAHLVERAVVLARGGDIDLEHLPEEVVGPTTQRQLTARTFQPLACAVREFEYRYLLEALEISGGKRGRTAELLGISRKNLWEKLRAHGIGGEAPSGPISLVDRSDDEG